MLTTQRLNRNAVACIVRGRLTCHRPRAIGHGYFKTDFLRYEPVANGPEGSQVIFARRRVDYASVLVYCPND